MPYIQYSDESSIYAENTGKEIVPSSLMKKLDSSEKGLIYYALEEAYTNGQNNIKKKLKDLTEFIE